MVDAGGPVIYACICYGLNEQLVREIIRSGATTLEALAAVCRAGTDCGSCHDRLLEMIEEEMAHASHSSVAGRMSHEG